MTNLYFPICAFFCALLLFIVFFSKPRVNNKETKIFSLLLISSFIDTVLMVIIIYIGYVDPDNKILYLLNRFDFIQYIMWAWAFYLYIFYISFNNSKIYNNFHKVLKLTGLLNCIMVVLIFMLPIYLHNQDNVMYAYGPAVNCTYIISAVYLVLIIICVLWNIKNIVNRKYMPLFALIILAVILFIVRQSNPEILVIPAILSYIDLIMYFTIENPDVKMVRQLELAKNTAEKANRAKSDFLSSMSHEIRTPLNAIVGLSESIALSNDVNEIHEDAKDVVMASQNLLEIVNGILDISKIEANKMEIIESNYDPIEVFTSLTNLVKTRIGEKQIELRTYFAPDIPNNLYGDKGKVKQIITNLLTNAVKYTEKGYIDFNVSCINEEDSCRLQITVNDTGRGIKEEQMGKLFTKFNRLEEDRNTTIEGTGLGLAITKSLTEMMGGKIVVSSTYGEGSKFTVFLKQKIVSDSSTNKQEIKEAISFNERKVLVVDDNKLNIKVTLKLLREYGLILDSAESGFECIEKVKSTKYDLIFMDIMMPKMSGEETLNRLKELEGFNTPVVALTADAMAGNDIKYIEAGFNEYVSKPIERQELERVLNKCLNGVIVDNKKEVVEDPKIHDVIPITDKDIELLNKKISEENN